MFPIFESIIYALGIFLGPLFGAKPGPNQEVAVFLEHFLVFSLCIVCWVGFEHSFANYLNKTNQKESSQIKILIQGLGVFITCVIFLGVLHSFKIRNEHFIAILMLGAIGSRIIRIISKFIKTYWAYFLGIFLETTLIGALSFYVITQRATWQPLVIGAGFGFVRTAISIAKNLAAGSTLAQKSPKTWSATYALTFFLGPIAWAFLAYRGQLPQSYAAALLLLVPFSKCPSKYRQSLELGEEDLKNEAVEVYHSTITMAILMVLLAAILLVTQ